MTVKHKHHFINWQRRNTAGLEGADLMQEQPLLTPRIWLVLLRKFGIWGAIVLLPVLAIAVGIGQWWAKENLVPIINQELTKSIKRPFNLGKISGLSLNQARFSNVEIPASKTDRDRVVAKEVIINFDPLKLATDRTLKLDIKVVEPKLYIDQDVKGNWVNIPPQEPIPEGIIKTKVNTIAIEQATATLVPYSKNPQAVIIRDVNSLVEVDARQEQVKVDSAARIGQEGRLQIQGNGLISQGAVKLDLKAKKLAAVDISNLVKIPAVFISQGAVDGNLSLEVKPKQPPRLFGNLLVSNARIAIDQVPRTFDRTNGWLQVSDRDVKFSNVTTNYGKIAGLVNGKIDFQQGYQLTAKTARTAVGDFLNTISVPAPVPLSGELVGEVKLTGKLDRPILTGKYANTQIAQIDRVQLNQIRGDFTLANGKINVKTIAEPQLGGRIQSQGDIYLLANPKVSFQFQGQNLPGDSFTQLYGGKLPANIAIGNSSLTGTIAGLGNNLVTNVRLQAPQATYPTIADLNIAPNGKIYLHDGEVKVAGDRVKVRGEIDHKNWLFNVTAAALDTRKLAPIIKAKLPAAYQGKLGGNVQILGTIDDPNLERLQVRGDAHLQLPAGKITARQIQISGDKWRANVSSNNLNLQTLDPQLPAALVGGNFQVSGDSIKEFTPDRIVVQGQGEAIVNGSKIIANNLTINRGIWQGLFTTNNLALNQFNPQVNGRLTGQFNLAGTVENFTLDRLRGNGNGVINLPQGQITARDFQIDRGQWQGNLKLNSLGLGGLSNQIPRQFTGAKIDGNFNVAGNLQQLDPQHIQIVGDGQLKLAQGQVTAKQLQLRSGKWQGQFNFDRFQVGSITNALPNGWKNAQLSGKFQAAGALDQLTPDQIQLIGNGRLQIGTGTITATDLEIADANWRGKIGFNNFELGTVNQQIASQLKTAKLTGNFNLTGNLQNLDPNKIQGNGAGEVIIPGGIIQTRNLELERGKVRANVGITGLGLGLLNRQLPKAIQAGKLNGNYRIAANLNQLTPEQIDIAGNGYISNILGGNIQLDDIAIATGQWQGKLTAESLNIGTLTKFSPSSIADGQLNGNLSGSWEMAGNINDPNPAKIRAIGITKLTNFRVGAMKFAPTLIGNVQANPGQGVDIHLTGAGDRLSLVLDRNLQPQSFQVQQGQIAAQGLVNDKIFNIDITSLPIALIKPWIPKSAGISQYRLAGNATGNIAIDLAHNHISGNQLTITKPVFGGFQGDRLVTNFRATPQQIRLSDTTLEVQNNRYFLTATFDPTATTPTFQAKLTVPQGKLEDLRDLLQIYSLADLRQPLNQRQYGTAADLRLPPTQNTKSYPLNYELQRLSELRRWLDLQAERQQADPIPDIRYLQGDFAGEIALANNSKTGLTADFNLIGQKWNVDRYYLDLVEARGKWERGKLALDPLAVTSNQTQIILRGDFGLNRQTAQVEVRNLPTKWVKNLTPLPVDVDGGVNINAQIGGNYQNPQVNGNLTLINAQLNQTKLDSATANFNYRDGRLDFASRANFDRQLNPLEADAIAVTGSIPYQFPFALTPPRNLDLAIDLNLQNRGLQIIDVLSKKQLRWIDGNGKIDLQIRGKMSNDSQIDTLTAKGIATLDRAKVQSIALPEPITDLHGQVVFDFDRLNVEHLEGKFGRGSVQISGLLPISDVGALKEQDKQLQVAMKGLTVQLPEKYQGNVDGELKIDGTALNPSLSGKVLLSQGKVLLPDSSPVTASGTLISVPMATPTATTNNNSIQLKNFQVTLGDNLQISRPPLLTFTATGTLDIDGTIDEPRPFGQVKLQKGIVNLFTTQFRLANGYPQTADFFPTLGSDPVLNLRLVAKTLESTSSPLAKPNSIAKTAVGSEINETANFYTGLGSVQTIQVEARIAGLASQITQRLELTSTPPRTQSEIVLLLGGGLVERLAASGDNNLGLGIINFASSGVLNNLQDYISDALSLSDFRLFPTITTNNTANNTSTLGIAAELGMEISPKLSTSVLKILTNDELPQYGLRYRLNDQMLMRGSTNLFGENRATIEFEQRF